MAGAAGAIEFYKKAFDATEQMRMEGPNGRVAHAEIKIGDSVIMLADEMPAMGYKGPKELGGTPVSQMLYFKRLGCDVPARNRYRGDATATPGRPVLR